MRRSAIKSISIMLVLISMFHMFIFDESFIRYAFAADEVVYISSVEDLKNISENPNGNFVLTTNISVSGWTPLCTKDKPFKGTFDGNNKTISLSFDSAENNGDDKTQYIGLFGYTDVVTVNDLNLKISGNISSYKSIYMGAFAGKSDVLNVSNCTVSTDIKMTSESHITFGSFVGECRGNNFTNINCDNNIVVHSYGDISVGGLIGGTNDYSNLHFTDCVADGKMMFISEGGNLNIGGFIGSNASDTAIKNCKNYTEININASNRTENTIGANIGGFIGKNFTNFDALNINQSFNNGVITADFSGEYHAKIGGLFGTFDRFGGNAICNECYNNGTINVKNNSTNSILEVGGIAGYFYVIGNCVFECKNSFNSAVVSAYGFEKVNAGGIVSNVSSYTYRHTTNCYNVGKFLFSNCTEINASFLSPCLRNGYDLIRKSYYLETLKENATGDGTSLTFEEMICQDSFEGFDFDTVWTISPNSNYPFPYLREVGNEGLNYLEWGDGNTIEDILYREGLPKLSHEDAIKFLSFIYDTDFSDVDLTNDDQYKLLTGSLSGYSAEKIKSMISAFSVIVDLKINTYIASSEYKSNVAVETLIKRLENELPSLTDPISGSVNDAILSMFNGVILSTYDLDEEIASKACDMLDTIGTVADIPNKVNEFMSGLSVALDTAFLAINQNTYGRYSYFNNYLINRGAFSGEAFDSATSWTYICLSTDTCPTRVLDYIPWLFGEDSWTNHKSDIEMMAEFYYQLTEYQNKDIHNYVSINRKATCVNDGYTEHQCTTCDLSYKDSYTDALGHQYQTTAVKPTCIDSGYTLYKCKRCSDSYVVTGEAATGHLNYKKVIISPSCTTTGYELYSCSCGASWKENEVPIAGHSYVSTVTSPTETEQGYTFNKCSVCGDEYYSDYVDPTGHTFTVTTVEPECESDGYSLHVCEGCGYEYTDNNISATGHSYVLDSETAATCAVEGKKIYKCVRCELTYEETITGAVEHDYTYTQTVYEPTCETKGYTENKCICGACTIESESEALGHSYTVIDEKEVTCITDGYKKYQCDLCNDVYTEYVAAPESGHDYEVVKAVEAGCLNTGYTYMVCKVCSTECYEDVVPPLDHTMGQWNVILDENGVSTQQRKRACERCDFYQVEENPNYRTTFIVDGVVIETYESAYGDAVIKPADPIKEAYIFTGWCPSVSETVPDMNMEYTAVFEPIQYTATFVYGEKIVGTDKFTVEDSELDLSVVEIREGYSIVCDEYEIIASDITVEVDYILDIYTASFVIEGEVVSVQQFSVENMTVIEPQIPEKTGYTSEWESYEMLLADFTVNAVYTPIAYTATFTSNGETIGTDEFIVSDESLDYPIIEEKIGYEWVWDDHEIVADDITVNGEYVLVTYTATFVIDGEAVNEQQFTVEDPEITAPDIPQREGYTAEWEEYEGTLSDLTINAIYTPIMYTAIFMHGDEIIGTDEFIVSDEVLDYPEITAKEYYEWVWDDHEIIAGEITINGEYVPIVYTATFVAGGITVDTIEFSVENQSVITPEIPKKAGYTAVWENYEVTLSDFTVNAVYTPIVYTATFTHNGEVIGTDEFTVEDASLNYPAMETKVHYNWIWDEHEIIADDITVNGEYVPITYTIKFVSNEKTVKTQSFTVETVYTVTSPNLSLPSKTGYYSEWEEWEGKICNLTVNEVYVPIKYTASFYCDNILVMSRTFTVETKIEQLPTSKAPTRAGYYAVWDEYSIVPRDIEIHARYVPIEYTAQFIADGVVVSTQKFTVENESLDEPDVPQKAGYVARWSGYKIEAKDISVVAKYNLLEVVTVSKRTLDVGETFRLLPSCNFEVTEKSWSSSDSSVATVNQHGNVTAVGKGECEITVTCYGKDSLGNDIQASKVTKIIVNDETEPQNFKQSFREMFNEFFEVKLHELLYNLREFMIVLFRYAY